MSQLTHNDHATLPARRRQRFAIGCWILVLALPLILAACGTPEKPGMGAQGRGIRVRVTHDIESTPDPLATQTPDGGELQVLSPEETMRKDAERYALEMGVTLDEALRRFEYMEEIGPLNARLASDERDTFAGLWVEHQPEFRVFVLFTRGGERTIRPYIRGRPWADRVEVRKAEFSYAELETIHAQTARLLAKLPFAVQSALDVKENRVEVRVTDRGWFEQELKNAALTLPRHVELVVVEGQSAQQIDVCAPSPVPGVAFPRQAPVEGMRATMAAELIGELTLVDGCLRVNSIHGPVSYLPVWPAEYTLQATGDEIQVLDGGGQVVAQVGQEVYLGGGEGSVGAMPDCVREQLPAACEGPYWVVGDTVRPNLRQDSELFSLDVLAIEERSLLYLRKKPLLDRWAKAPATLSGTLEWFEYERCMVVLADGAARRYLPLWPPGYTVRLEGDAVEIVDGAGQPVARVGEEVRLEGAPLPASWDREEYRRMVRELPGDCNGPYWSVKDATGASLGLEELVDELRARGRTVVRTERAVDHGFPIHGVRLLVDEAAVFVYEFPDLEATQTAAAGLSTDAYSVTVTSQEGENTRVHHSDWIETPHVYVRGRVIVLTGDNPQVLDALDSVLGPQHGAAQ